MRRVRAAAQRQSLAAPLYLAVDFSIITPALSAQGSQIADGVIMCTALVKRAELAGNDPAPAVVSFATELAQAARRISSVASHKSTRARVAQTGSVGDRTERKE